MEIAFFFGLFLLLLIFETPVAFSMMLASFGFMLLDGQMSLKIIPERITTSLDSFPLLAVPFFVMAGSLMNKVGISKRIFDFALTLFGHLRGGLGHVNVIASMIFAGMSGSALADAAGLGAIEIQAMIDEGYDRDFSAAVTAVSSCIGPVIPPSIVMIVYGVMAEVSIGELFAAGFIPGVMMGISMMILIYIQASRGKVVCPKRERQPMRRVLSSTQAAFFPLLGPVIILGVILFGIATPTEAGVFAIIFSLVLGVAYRQLTWRVLMDTLEQSALTTGMILFIVAGAAIFGWLVTIKQVAIVFYHLMLTITTQKWLILLFINAILLFLGCFIEGIAIMIISVPALIPVIKALQISPVHFGVIVVINIMIGLVTPPMGMSIYIVSDLAKVSVGKVIRAVLPFLIPLIVVLLITTYFPEIVLWLPNLIFKHLYK